MCLTVVKAPGEDATLCYKSRASAKRRSNKPLVATKAFKVYKMFVHFGESQLKSPYQNFYYEKNKRYTTKLGVEIDGDSIWSYQINIHEGFHAFVKPIRMNGSTRILIECTVPKGAKYFYGDSGDIVSNKIIIGNKPYKEPVEPE